jgi:hypothetical protein
MLSTVWSYEKQFMPHNPKAKALMTKGQLGLNPFGKPEGFFVFGKAPNDYIVAVDLDLQKEKLDDGREVDVVVGLNMLCPRCGSSCYVHGPKHPNGREIIVHWDKMQLSEVDLKMRPPVTIVGPIACDYSWEEINGIVSPRRVSKCAWRGQIDMGRAYEVQLVRT